jgi:Mrp family chromosome partitioning ATPase
LSRLFDAVANARSLVVRPGGVPDRARRLPGALSATDLPLLRLWQGIEARLAGHPRKVVLIVACTEGEADPAVAVRLARLAGRGMSGGVIVLNSVASETVLDDDGVVAFGPLPGRGGDARALNPALIHAYWERLSQAADLIILDAPPLLSSPLAQALAPTADGVVLLVEAERTRSHVAAAARDALAAAGANVLGVVLNKRRYHVPKALYDRL